MIVERRARLLCQRLGVRACERLQKRDQLFFLRLGQIQPTQALIALRIGAIAGIIKIDHVAQRREGTVAVPKSDLPANAHGHRETMISPDRY